MKATLDYGLLQPIPRSQIQIPAQAGSPPVLITLRILPEITDSKSASYQDESIIGRAYPIKAYSHSENRTITMKCHFIILEEKDARQNLEYLRALQSAVYPRESDVSPYLPPPICRIRHGNLLAGSKTDGWICVVLKSYSVTFPTDVAYYSTLGGDGPYIPYKFDVDLTWDAVFASEDLPGQQKIMGDI